MQEIIPIDINNEQVTTLVQYDMDVNLYFSEPYITYAAPVHFFNKNCTEAYVVKTEYSNDVLKAQIPNILLTETLPIIGYIHIQQDNGDRSLYCFNISVRPRPMPSNYILTDTDYYGDLAEILETCLRYADSCSSSASSASTSATNAASSATTATNSMNSAATSATNAANSASEAAQSAKDSASSAATSKECADEATATLSEIDSYFHEDVTRSDVDGIFS